MAIAMTDQQKDDLNRKGYFVVENLLGPDEVAAVAAAMHQVAAEVRAERGLGPGDKVALRNGMIRHPKLLDLMDHRKRPAKPVSMKPAAADVQWAGV